MTVDIEPVLLRGDEAAVRAFAYDTDRCVVVDWREDEADLIAYVAHVIPEAGLQFAWDEADEDLILSSRGRTLRVGLTMSPSDRYVTIRAINRLLAGEYELRLFRATYASDTHAFYAKPARWWEQAERAHPARIARVFRAVDPELDLP